MIDARIGPARAVWTDRRGGVSLAPYDTANLSTRGDDAVEAVRENRVRLAGTLGLGPPDEWWWLAQVHGADVVTAPGLPPVEAPSADAAVTVMPGIPLVVLTADCAPIALVCDDAIAVVHAGWPGLLVGVIERAVTHLRAIGRGEVRAMLGPCIHPASYEFGRADLDRVVARLGSDVVARTRSGSLALDLPAGVRAALRAVDVTSFQDVGVCTADSSEHFSYRRDGETGRQALVLVLEP